MTPPADPPAPDARVEIATLTARLRVGPSATAVLEAWCAERGFSAAFLVAERISGPQTPPGAIRHRRLALSAHEAVRHRRVRLVCGGHVLSVADNWYVPGRLTPAMNHGLDATDVPFGRVVQSLAPTRRTLDVRTLRDTDTPPRADEALFAVAALLATPDGVPFCEVDEIYLGAVLGGLRDGPV